MADDNDDVLSLSNSGCEDNLDSDLGVTTRGAEMGEKSKATKAKSRIIKGSSLPTKRKLQTRVKQGPKAKMPKVVQSDRDLNELKDKLGIDSLVKSVSSLSDVVKKHVVTSTISNNNVSNDPALVVDNSSMERQVRNNNSNVSVTVSRPYSSRPRNENPRQLISWGDHDLDVGPCQYDDGEYFDSINDFDLSYLPQNDNDDDPFMEEYELNERPAPVTKTKGVNPNIAFHDAFHDACSESGESLQPDINNNCSNEQSEWDIPQLKTTDKTSPKVGNKLAEAVNAAMTVKSDKKCMEKMLERHARPENCNLLTVPRVNSEIWDVIPKNAHSNDRYIQDVQNAIVAGLVPIIQVGDQLAKGKEPLDPTKTLGLFSDSLSLLGYAFHSLSMKRRYDIRRFLNPRYQKICSSETALNAKLFGDNIMTRVKELGDPNKTPLGIYRHGYGRGRLNSRGPVATNHQGQGQLGNRNFPRGRGYPRVPRSRGRGSYNRRTNQ